MATRFYQIAFDLGVAPRSFIRELSDVGLSVGNQMVVVTDELETRIREVYNQLHPVETEAPPAPDETEAEPVAADDQPATDATEAEAAPVVEAAPAVTEGEEAPPAAVETPAAEAEQAAAAAPEAPAAPVKPDATDRRVHRAGSRPRPVDLVPTIDPRAGRLVKDAPAGGVPTPETKRPRSPAGREDRNRPGGGGGSTMDRAPGARRDGSRHGPKDPYARKRGKETFQMRRRGLRRRRTRGPAVPKVHPTSVEVELPITVKAFGELTLYKAAELIRILFRNHKIMVTPNSVLDREKVEILSVELEIEVNFVTKDTTESLLLREFEQATGDDEKLEARPPVVTILGHVDHGKTTLLDYIRKVDTASREAGGITQHIASCQVTLDDGRRVTFIDTPGHEAFSDMRARGAQVTDVVILIVAGDDGVMPQTIEAISHAKAAGVEIVVAVTKCDKPGINVERAKQQLSEHEVYVEGYGGDVSVFEVSGITGQGVKELLEHLALMAEVDAEKFRANPAALATGVVLESESNPRRGILSTVLVKNGTLRKGDSLLAGNAHGTVRGMFDSAGKMVKEAGPSMPVEVVGLSEPPEAGEQFYEVDKGSKAKEIADVRRQRARREELAAQGAPTSVEALLGRIDQSKVDTVPVIVKADVGGSLQPLKTVLGRLTNPEVRVEIIHAGVGPINESDVGLANASKATIIGFNVKADAKAREKAKSRGVDWRTYKVIYDIESDVMDLMEGRLAPHTFEEVIGHAEILAIFTFSKIGNIAGCRVRDGFMQRDCFVRVKRGDELLHEGEIAALRREKDSVKEVKEGFECGITIKNFDAFDVGDIIEGYVIKSVKRTLADVEKDARKRERERAEGAGDSD